MHAFGFQPRFQVFAGIGAEFNKHFSFEHVDKHALRTSEPAGLHALRKSFSSLAREAGKRVLCEIAWHKCSSEVGIQVFHRLRVTRTLDAFQGSSRWGKRRPSGKKNRKHFAPLVVLLIYESSY